MESLDYKVSIDARRADDRTKFYHNNQLEPVLRKSIELQNLSRNRKLKRTPSGVIKFNRHDIALPTSFHVPRAIGLMDCFE